jgi:acetyltransferase-like isoleucine patch superfamily enzyme
MKLIHKLIKWFYLRSIYKQLPADVARRVVLGPDVWHGFHINYAENISIGDRTVINGCCHIDCRGGVEFGRYCHVAKGATILSSNHNWKSQVSLPYDEKYILKKVSIGNAVWIGANVTILPGSTIGDGAILAAGSVVRGAVGEGEIYSGNPARCVSRRDKEIFEVLLKRESFF